MLLYGKLVLFTNASYKLSVFYFRVCLKKNSSFVFICVMLIVFSSNNLMFYFVFVLPSPLTQLLVCVYPLKKQNSLINLGLCILHFCNG